MATVSTPVCRCKRADAASRDGRFADKPSSPLLGSRIRAHSRCRLVRADDPRERQRPELPCILLSGVDLGDDDEAARDFMEGVAPLAWLLPGGQRARSNPDLFQQPALALDCERPPFWLRLPSRRGDSARAATMRFRPPARPGFRLLVDDLQRPRHRRARGRTFVESADCVCRYC